MHNPTTTMEEQIEKNGYFIGTPNGISMWPMIRNRKDTVLLVKPTGKLKKYDIPLYRTNSGKYIIHRIINVSDKTYIICGDGVTCKEYNVTDKNIIAVTKGFYRGEKYISCNSKLYMIYAKVWTFLLPIRKPILYCKYICSKLKRKITGK